jgi:methionyl-tRNA formyltransferase
MGSPAFAVPSLEALIEARFDVRLVVTQPDRRSGRGQRLEATDVKRIALAQQLPLIEFGPGDRERVARAVLGELPDAVVVVAFGHILREPLLSGPPLGCLNLHASLLPRWRGVSPVHHAILHGDAWTGVTIMRLDHGVDTGPILSQEAVAISPEETAGELTERLAGLGADLIVRTLRACAAGPLPGEPQGDVGAVYAPKLTRSLSPLRWDRPVTVVANQVRGLQPWPGATTFLGDQLLKITAARLHSFRTADSPPGTVLAVDQEGIRVACGEGELLVTMVQAPGRRPLEVAEFLRGHTVRPGEVLNS